MWIFYLMSLPREDDGDPGRLPGADGITTLGLTASVPEPAPPASEHLSLRLDDRDTPADTPDR